MIDETGFGEVYLKNEPMHVNNDTSDKAALLFVTHFLSRHILKEYMNIKTQCSSKYDVILLCETSHWNFGRATSNLPITPFYFDFNRYSTLGYRNWQTGRWRQGVVPGNLDFLFLSFFLENPNYDYYWILEYDVRFTGRWKTFFDRFSHSEADLLTTTVRRYAKDPSWFWWFAVSPPTKTLEPRLGKPLTNAELIAGFMPIARFSRKACTFLDKMYKLDWCGHHEVIVPSLLARHGFSIEDIGGTGEFVKRGNENRFYTGRLNGSPALLRTFRYRPTMHRSGWGRNRLWHPVKEDLPYGKVWREKLEWIDRWVRFHWKSYS